jgi:hypothetical protein
MPRLAGACQHQLSTDFAYQGCDRPDRRSDRELPDLSRRRDAVTEVYGRLGHSLVVGDYYSEVLA